MILLGAIAISMHAVAWELTLFSAEDYTITVGNIKGE